METINLIRAIWNSQPTSEKLLAPLVIVGFPILFWAVWVMTP